MVLLVLAACGVQPVDEAEDSAVIGNVVRFAGATGCQTLGNTLPWIHTMSTTAPRIDAWFPLIGARGTTPLLSDPPIQAAWLISHERLTTPWSSPAAPGCELLVDPFATLICLDRDWSKPLPAGLRTAAWRQGPHALIILQPIPALFGRSLFLQLACMAPGENFAGMLISKGVELRIGN